MGSGMLSSRTPHAAGTSTLVALRPSLRCAPVACRAEDLGLDSSTDLESRSTTSFLGRAWLTEKETRKVDFEDVRTITITMACWQRGVKPGHAV